MVRIQIVRRPTWQRWMTPKPLREKPIHSWYVFPHSFTSELVEGLIGEWELDVKDRILDPFCGAGTTLLTARQHGIPSLGYDLSPLAVLASRTKIANHNPDRLSGALDRLVHHLTASRRGVIRDYPPLVRDALPGALLGVFERLGDLIDRLPQRCDRDFFWLALLSLLPEYSRATVTGGWLKWTTQRTRCSSLASAFRGRVETMLHDLQVTKLPIGTFWNARRGDARNLPNEKAQYSAVITSPPYPNRHDYTRVFGVELMFAFLGWNETRRLRYQSFHSHPEAHPKRPRANGYRAPEMLQKLIRRVARASADPRVPRMLGGYFLDTYICLREMKRLCRKGARIAWIVGNARYCGHELPVDKLAADIGEQAGLTPQRIVAVRYRGNSAQQMAEFGRRPSRESIVVFNN